MSDKPILFSAPMVRALLAGAKTQTRRALNPQPFLEDGSWKVQWGGVLRCWQEGRNPGIIPNWLRIAVGDRLYVREAWRVGYEFEGSKPSVLAPKAMPVLYEADAPHSMPWEGRLRPSMHMPRWASRLTLTVTDVRVQRLQDISQSDAQDEGIQRVAVLGGNAWRDYSGGDGFNIHDPGSPAVRSYASLWNSINGPGSWEANPWVAAYTFSVEHRNIDQLARAA